MSNDPNNKPDANKPDPNAKPEPKPGDKPADGAPEKYEPFTAPDGYKLDDTIVAEAGSIFKELNLPQASAQRLVDFYNKQMIAAAEAPLKAVTDMRTEWKNEVISNPALGTADGLKPEVKTSINNAINAIGDQKLIAEFRTAMDITGAGDHPAFVAAMNKLGSFFKEGAHVTGGGPSPLGQKANGGGDQRTAAQAMYPNLPSANATR